MHLTKGLFTAEEAFARLGQSREEGCFVVVSKNWTARLFTKEACVVYATSEGIESPNVVDSCFADYEASYVWMPGAKPPKEIMNINIVGHTLKSAIAKDVHLSVTAKVKLDNVDMSTIPKHKRVAQYYLMTVGSPNDKWALTKGTVIVGRDNSCDIVVSNEAVSRRHCLLQAIPRGLRFRDLESSNGVFINGIHAKEGFVQPGDKLCLGSYALSVLREN